MYLRIQGLFQSSIQLGCTYFARSFFLLKGLHKSAEVQGRTEFENLMIFQFVI
jgi:hypothetical protein